MLKCKWEFNMGRMSEADIEVREIQDLEMDKN